MNLRVLEARVGRLENAEPDWRDYLPEGVTVAEAEAMQTALALAIVAYGERTGEWLPELSGAEHDRVYAAIVRMIEEGDVGGFDEDDE